jgi:hypothetical protein
LVRVRREGAFLWYTANTESLQEIINFLYAECCTRNRAVCLASIIFPYRSASSQNQTTWKLLPHSKSNY